MAVFLRLKKAVLDDLLILDCPDHGWLCTACPKGEWKPFSQCSERTREGLLRELLARGL